ncbi:unnamed protein product [Ilex paraguariensis]|uniref:Wall-associated receptor kinase galacturonan-binding domain-containing protein n=1 Tax=Ilex paraguariensis TaxID=185542 RepID=A0ABC8T283_9AQUA
MAPELLLVLQILSIALLFQPQGTASMAKLDCQQKCGHMTIPYPFGIGQGCCMEKEFEVTCTNGSWAWLVGELFVLDLSLDYIRVGGGSMAIDCFNDSGTNSIGLNYKLNLRFSFSHTQNKFVAVGCDIFAYIIDPKSANYTIVMKLREQEAFYAAGTTIVMTTHKARDISAVVWMVTTGALTFLRDATAATCAVAHRVIRSITMQVDILDANLMEEGHHLLKLLL